MTFSIELENNANCINFKDGSEICHPASSTREESFPALVARRHECKVEHLTMALIDENLTPSDPRSLRKQLRGITLLSANRGI